MKFKTIAFAIATFSALIASVHADTGKTREQVKVELAEAIRNGDIISDENGLTKRELFPFSYPAVPVAVGKTREQVKAEYAEAVRTGDLYGPGRGNRKLNEIYPDRYPPQAPVMGKTRDQVRAELAEAQRTGDIDIGEDGLTAAERNPSRYQAARAQRDVDAVRTAGSDMQRAQRGMAAPGRLADH